MADETTEEFRRFILENREMIEKILNEDKKGTEDKFEKRTEDAKEKLIDLNNTVLQMISDDEVQRHFITGCLEFLHFFEALIAAAPLSPEARSVVDRFEDTRDTTVRNVVVVGAKDRMRNVHVDNEQTETPSERPKPKQKFESITINDCSRDKDKE